jgi:UDP-N-acetylglucosamine 2-epimerase
MAPVVRTLREDPAFSVRLVATGQHREMLDQVLRLFALTPDEDLNIMTPHQTLTEITLRTLEGLDRVMRAHPVDVVLAQGDTTTTFVAALCAFYHKTPFGHVEAGLRTYDLYHPFPEEMNRRLTAPIARFHFAPTERARQNLIQEYIPPEHIWVTGNTGIDAVLWVAQQPVVPHDRGRELLAGRGEADASVLRHLDPAVPLQPLEGLRDGRSAHPLPLRDATRAHDLALVLDVVDRLEVVLDRLRAQLRSAVRHRPSMVAVARLTRIRLRW